MKSQPSARELLIIRLICYSTIAWAVTYVYLNSWTGLNINKLEQARLAEIEKKEALKKSLAVLIEAGFSDTEVLNKECQLVSYFLARAEIDESKEALISLERTLTIAKDLPYPDRMKGTSLIILGYQYLNDFDKSFTYAKQCQKNLKLALNENKLNADEYKKLSGIIENNLAVNQYLQAGCEENQNLRLKLFAACLKRLEDTKKLTDEKTMSKIVMDNSVVVSRDLLFHFN